MKPILWQWGPVAIYAYGFLLALGFLLAHQLATLEARRVGMDARKVSGLVLLCFITGVIGARLFYAAQHFSYFRDHPLDIIRLDQGGLVWYGAALLAAGAAIPYMKLQGMPLLLTADLCAPFIALAQAFGRVGCFFNGCCYGIPAKAPWGVQFPNSHVTRLPVQLYSAFLLLLMATILYVVFKRSGRPGRVICLYGLLYGIGRFLLEFLRGDQLHYSALTLPQWMSLGLLALTALVWFRLPRPSEA